MEKHWKDAQGIRVFKEPFVPPILSSVGTWFQWTDCLKDIWKVWLAAHTDARFNKMTAEARDPAYNIGGIVSSWHHDCSGNSTYMIVWSSGEPTEIQDPMCNRIVGIYPFDVVMLDNTAFEHRAPQKTEGRWFCRSHVKERTAELDLWLNER